MTSKNKAAAHGKLILTVDQIKQLANWVGHEPHTEVSITKTVGDQGEGLYAFNIDHPDEGSLFLDGHQIETRRIFSAEELFGRKIPNTDPELATVAAKILHDYQDTGCMGLASQHATVTEVRSAVLTSPLGIFFLPWESGYRHAEDDERATVADEARQKSVRELFFDMEAARRREAEQDAESVRRNFIAANIAS